MEFSFWALAVLSIIYCGVHLKVCFQGQHIKFDILAVFYPESTNYTCLSALPVCSVGDEKAQFLQVLQLLNILKLPVDF